jgi:protein-S-isoprenylcysteine O-methyltransferase Ste14
VVSSGLLITGLWICFILYWIVSARGVKRSLGHEASRLGGVVRIIALGVVFAVAGNRSFLLPALHLSAMTARVLHVAGVVLCAAGIAVAIWARSQLGRNWGMPASVKEDPELITSGPYRVVRHPIYAGVLLAMIGSALVVGRSWLVLLGVFVVYFAYTARLEERTLARQFPDAYGRYRARTKMVVPYLL